MKNPLAKIPNEQAQKQLKQFATATLVCAAVALFIFGWIAIAGLGSGVRALLLSTHKGNKDNPKLTTYRIMAVCGILLSIVDLVLLAANKG